MNLIKVIKMTESVDHFKCNVRRYDAIETEIKAINDRLKPLQLKLKELKSSKKELEQNIAEYMQTNDIGECKMQTGSLTYKESKNVIPLSKDAIKVNMISFFTDSYTDEFKKLSPEDKGATLFSYIYENREYKESTKLKKIA